MQRIAGLRALATTGAALVAIALAGCASGPAIPGMSVVQDGAALQRLMDVDREGPEITLDEIRAIAARAVPAPPGMAYELGVLRKALAHLMMSECGDVATTFDAGRKYIVGPGLVALSHVMATCLLGQGRSNLALQWYRQGDAYARKDGTDSKLFQGSIVYLMMGVPILVDAGRVNEAEAALMALPRELNPATVTDAAARLRHQVNWMHVMAYVRMRQGQPEAGLTLARRAERQLGDFLSKQDAAQASKFAVMAHNIKAAQVEALIALGRFADVDRTLRAMEAANAKERRRSIERKIALQKSIREFAFGDYAASLHLARLAQSGSSVMERQTPMYRQQSLMIRLIGELAASRFADASGTLRELGPIGSLAFVHARGYALAASAYLALKTQGDLSVPAQRLREPGALPPQGAFDELSIVHYGARVQTSWAMAERSDRSAEWISDACTAGARLGETLRHLRQSGAIPEQAYPRHMLAESKRAYVAAALAGFQARLVSADVLLDALTLAGESEVDWAASAAFRRDRSASGLSDAEARDLQDAQLQARKAHLDVTAAVQSLDSKADQIQSSQSRLTQAAAQLEATLDRIQRQHPGFRERIQGYSPTVASIRSSLQGDGALLVLHQLPDHVVGLLISATSVQARTVPMGEAQVAALVDRLRSSAVAPRREPAGRPGAPRRGLERQEAQAQFDVDAARGIHELALGWARSAWPALQRTAETGAAPVPQLDVVVSGPLANLPFGILLPDDDRRRLPPKLSDWPWLIKRAAIAQVPSLGAWAAMTGTVNTRSLPAVGFKAWVNPQFDGRKAGTWASTTMPGTTEAGPWQLRGPGQADRGFRGTDEVAPRTATMSQRLDQLRASPMLPSTQLEGESLRSLFGASTADLLSGSAATREAVLEASRRGQLNNLKVLLFATHGFTAVGPHAQGEREPALQLAENPVGPALPLLTLTDVLSLRLDVEWTLLSACDTAAADASGLAFSGLARGFIFAGSRSVMVSQWQVDDMSTAELTRRTMSTYFGSGSTVSKAQALRLAALSLMQTPERPDWQHPFYWAPFVVVGPPRR